jgi:hypothetical protein
MGTSHSVSGKDRKNLKAALAKMTYSEEAINASVVEEIQIDKIIGRKTNLISGENGPLFFAPDGAQLMPNKTLNLILPSLYTLFDWHAKQIESGLLKVYIK